MDRTRSALAAAIVAMVAGWLLLMAMTIGVLPPRFVTALGAYALTLAGLSTGLVAVYLKWERRRR